MINKILFIRSDRFGEFLLSLPAIKLAKLNYPQARIYLLAQEENIELVRGIDFIDCFLPYSEARYESYRGAWRLSRLLRKEKIDCVVALHPKKEFHLASYLAGTKLRVGYDRKWGWCLNRKIEDKKYEAQKHEIEYNIDLMSLFCEQNFVPPIEFPTDNSETLASFADIIVPTKKYIVLHPFSSHPAKKVGPEFWLALIGKIKNEFTRDIIVIGAGEDCFEAQQLAQDAGITNLAGKLTLRNLAALLKYHCSFFVGLDSGPMHLASLMRVPVIGLFTISNPKRWGPFCSDSLVIQCGADEWFMEKIDNIISFISKLYEN